MTSGYIMLNVLVFFVVLQPKLGPGRLVSTSHTIIHPSGVTPLQEWSARCRGCYLHKH